jgi:hypothetical protein
MRHIWRIIKGLLLALCIVLTLASALGLIWRRSHLLYPINARWTPTPCAVGVSGGSLTVEQTNDARLLVATPDGALSITFSSGPAGPWLRTSLEFWGLRYAVLEYGTATVRMWIVPLWMPLLPACVYPALSLAIWMSRAARRRRADPEARPCPECGYDLRASPGRCPECGAE